MPRLLLSLCHSGAEITVEPLNHAGLIRDCRSKGIGFRLKLFNHPFVRGCYCKETILSVRNELDRSLNFLDCFT